MGNVLDKQKILLETRKRVEGLNYLQNTQNIQFSLEQYKVLIAQRSTTLVEAVPGSGKTFTLLNKGLLESLIPDNKNKVLILSHTNAVVDEMSEKIKSSGVPIKLLRKIEISTVDSLLKHKILDPFNYILIDTMENDAIIWKTLLNKEDITKLDIIEYKDILKRKLLERLNTLTHEQQLQFMKIRDSVKNINKLTKSYTLEELVPLANIVLNDFSKKEDILPEGVLAKEYDLNYDWILVDEYQDLNKEAIESIRVIQELNKNCKVIFFGDNNQSIFRFDDERIQRELKSRLPETREVWDKEHQRLENIGSKTDISNLFSPLGKLTLLENRRNSEEVIKLSNIVSRNVKSKGKRFKRGCVDLKVIKTDNKINELERITNILEKEKIEDNSCVIFRRNSELIEAYYYYLKNGIQVKSKTIEEYKLSNPYLKFEHLKRYFNNKDLSNTNLKDIFVNIFKFEDTDFIKRDYAYNLKMFTETYTLSTLNFKYNRNKHLLSYILQIESILNNKNTRNWVDIITKLKEPIRKYLELQLGYSVNSNVLNVIIKELYFDYFKINGQKNHKEIVLHTVHTSKGLEFDNVIIMPFIVDHKVRTIDPVEEENLLYVSITRARNNLSIWIDENNLIYDKILKDGGN